MIKNNHVSVLLNEVVEFFSSNEQKTYLDATFGAGGHTRAILDANPLCKIIAVDRDENATNIAEDFYHEYGNRFTFFNIKFSEIEKITEKIDGVLFDIGVSSMQIDDPQRGFSFLKDGPLTMTMGHNSISAYDIINNYSEEEIADILWKYGEERSSRKIASAVCEYRQNKNIETTVELAELIASLFKGRGKNHPATLTFQGLRVYVNDELNELEKGVEAAINKLPIGGIIAIITFQGLEDYVAKKTVKKFSTGKHVNKYTYYDEIDDIKLQNIGKKIIKPCYSEIKSNKRARSAKMRALTRIK